MTIGRLGTKVLERRLSWSGAEGCTAMVVLMNTDDDKDVQAEYKQRPRCRSSKQ